MLNSVRHRRLRDCEPGDRSYPAAVFTMLLIDPGTNTALRARTSLKRPTGRIRDRFRIMCCGESDLVQRPQDVSG
jgi:hypothetical protein